MASSGSFADRLTRGVEETVESPAFWLAILLCGTGAAVVRFRRPLVLAWKLATVRMGRRKADVDVVAVLFNRACGLAGRRITPRTDPETWREWIERIPDPADRANLEVALEIYERAQYGRGATTDEDFVKLEGIVEALRGRA